MAINWERVNLMLADIADKIAEIEAIEDDVRDKLSAYQNCQREAAAEMQAVAGKGAEDPPAVSAWAEMVMRCQRLREEWYARYVESVREIRELNDAIASRLTNLAEELSGN